MPCEGEPYPSIHWIAFAGFLRFEPPIEGLHSVLVPLITSKLDGPTGARFLLSAENFTCLLVS